MPPRNKGNRLEDLFNVAEDYLQKPAVEELRPGLVTATARGTDDDRLLKIWWKVGESSDSEFRELWNHERRQVERIMNYPDADDVMVRVVEMIETSDGFCVVYEAGVVPLAARMWSLPAHHWLNSLNVPSNRATLWANFTRLAKAIGIIHARGLIHGRIDRYAVFTDGSTTPDFKLGGFEWSLVIGDSQPIDPIVTQVRARIDQLIYSYADDWKALGTLFAELLDIDPARLREDDPFRADARNLDLSDAEIDFLRRLVDPSREDVMEPRWLAELDPGFRTKG